MQEYDRKYVNAETSKLMSEAIVAAQHANNQCVVRLVTAPPGGFWLHFNVKPEGYWESERHRMPVERTPADRPGYSRMAIAWWTDHKGNKHTRIKAERTRSKEVPILLKMRNESPFFAIFPESKWKDGDKTLFRCPTCERIGEFKNMMFDGDNCYICRDLKDYIAESGGLRPRL